jgi:hypothetical protein
MKQLAPDRDEVIPAGKSEYPLLVDVKDVDRIELDHATLFDDAAKSDLRCDVCVRNHRAGDGVLVLVPGANRPE